MATVPVNENKSIRNLTDKFLGGVTSFSTTTIKNAMANVSAPETGSYVMKIVFYLLFYAFVIFLVLSLVHFTITPVFRFTPGSKGIIGVSGTNDSGVYFPSVPEPLASAPNPDDKLSKQPFINNFSFSIDITVAKLPDTDASNRLVLFKTYDFDGSGRPGQLGMSEQQLNQLCGYSQSNNTTIASSGPKNMNIQSFMAKASSMIVFLTETNDLVVTFFVGSNGTVYNARPIRNIPLDTPFRLTVVVEEKLFTIYLNGKQTFQRIVSEGISLNSFNSLPTNSQRFYAPPTWADQPKKSIYIQNLILWPRAISYGEVINASPSLATLSSFGIPSDVSGASCT
jgi:hypothetical protein